MRHRLVILALLGLCLGAPNVFAQDHSKLARALTSASPAELNRLANQTKIKDYVFYWADQLSPPADSPTPKSQLDIRTAAARRKLIEPMYVRGATTPFKAFYSRQISHSLLNRVKALQSTRVTARLNAMIVTAELVDAGAIDLVIKGLADTNESCRYWAAKAVSEIATLSDEIKGPIRGNEKEAKALRAKLLPAMSIALNGEKSTRVMKQIARAFVDVNTTAAVQSLVQWLNARVNTHASAQQALTMEAELAAVRELYGKIHLKEGGVRVTGKPLRELTRVAYRCLSLSAALIDLRAVDNEARISEYKGMIVECNDRLLRRHIMPKFGVAKMPKALVNRLSNDEVAIKEIRLSIEEWKDILSVDPIKIDKTALEVTLREEGGATADPPAPPE
jgi:hypothetical protein